MTYMHTKIYYIKSNKARATYMINKLFEELINTQLVKRLPAFMEPRGSALSSQNPMDPS
jgi:hypothetical protein